ncbi:MAG: sulfatase [Myxococcales bacterium]|nr:sulfatase [Myxococcales bacterium]
MEKVSRRMNRLTRAGLAIGCLILLWLSGCDGAPNEAPPKPPVVLIVIDTVRDDHCGFDGYARQTTPFLAKFARQSVRFTAAHSSASWTLPSVATLFTGVSPTRHGMELASTEQDQQLLSQVLNDKFLTLAESLKERGYNTYGINANYHLQRKIGIAQGFDYYKIHRYSTRKKVDVTVEKTLEIIRAADSESQPYFLYVHYFDPHHPYKAQEPYFGQWHVPGKKDRDDQEVARRFDEKYYLTHRAELADIVDRYDSEIAGCDESIGRWLPQVPRFDEALVIVTADHGEAFTDHDNLIHGGDLYEEVLHVPLLIRLPGGRSGGTTSDALVGLIDLYPTIAALTGATAPSYLEGLDLRPAQPGLNPALAGRRLFAHTRHDPSSMWSALLNGKQKLLYRQNRETWMLFDLAADPAEKNDRLATLPVAETEAARRDLRRQLLTLPLYRPGSIGQDLSEGLKKQMKSLGYL